ncbi:MAG: protein rep [Candidatus Omnitrophica bacterium]|nr:protein rep [Candidatus Omnitrophota bacterium]
MPSHEFLRLCCYGCGKFINVPVYCGDRFCPVCMRPRLARLRKRLAFLVCEASRSNATRFKHITFTLRNMRDLPAMVKKLVSSFRKVRQSKLWKTYVDGGAFVIEVTYNQEHSTWHAHIHAIVQCNWIPWEKLLQTWLHASGGSRGVYIAKLPASQAVKYLTKYMTKPSVEPGQLPQVNQALKGLRLFSPFGTWYAINRTYEPAKHPCSDCGRLGAYDLAYHADRGPMTEWLTVGKAGKPLVSCSGVSG